MSNPRCPKCQGRGYVKEPDGRVHTCWDCLNDGSLDNHSKDLKDSGIKV